MLQLAGRPGSSVASATAPPTATAYATIFCKISMRRRHRQPTATSSAAACATLNVQRCKRKYVRSVNAVRALAPASGAPAFGGLSGSSHLRSSRQSIQAASYQVDGARQAFKVWGGSRSWPPRCEQDTRLRATTRDHKRGCVRSRNCFHSASTACKRPIECEPVANSGYVLFSTRWPRSPR